MPADLDLIRGRTQQRFNDLYHPTPVGGGIKELPGQLREALRDRSIPGPTVSPCRWDGAAGALGSSWLSTWLQEARTFVFVRLCPSVARGCWECHCHQPCPCRRSRWGAGRWLGSLAFREPTGLHPLRAHTPHHPPFGKATHVLVRQI